MNTTETKTEPILEWDEPEGCSSPRGWLHITPETHPDRDAYAFEYHADNGLLCCGNYLSYEPFSSRGPNGETVHAVAYFHRCDRCSQRSDIRLGYCWFHTIQEAKDFIAGNVRAYLGFPR